MTARKPSFEPWLHVTKSRFIEWFCGRRPLPGTDAMAYFKEGVATGVTSPEEAAELLARHLRLSRREAAKASGVSVCETCNGAPPSGLALPPLGPITLGGFSHGDFLGPSLSSPPGHPATQSGSSSRTSSRRIVVNAGAIRGRTS